MHRKIFRDISIKNFISKASFFAYFCTFSDFRIGLPGGMKIQKSLRLHVLSLRMRSNDGMVMKLFSAQRYDPRQVFESTVWCAEPYKKFSRPPKSYTVDCVIHNSEDTSETSFRIGLSRSVNIQKSLCFHVW